MSLGVLYLSHRCESPQQNSTRCVLCRSNHAIIVPIVEHVRIFFSCRRRRPSHLVYIAFFACTHAASAQFRLLSSEDVKRVHNFDPNFAQQATVPLHKSLLPSSTAPGDANVNTKFFTFSCANVDSNSPPWSTTTIFWRTIVSQPHDREDLQDVLWHPFSHQTGHTVHRSSTHG